MMVAGSLDAAVAQLGAALDAAAGALPLAGAERGSAEATPSPALVLPGPDAPWIAVQLVGAPVSLVLAVAAAATADLLDPHDSARVQPAFGAAAAQLGATLGEASAGRGPGLPEAPVAVAVRFTANGLHVATLVALTDASGGADRLPTPDAASFPPLEGVPVAKGDATRPGRMAQPIAINLLRGVELNVTVELGRTTMTVRDLLQLVPGSVIELDRAAGSPVDLLVNGTLLARGEVVVIDEEYGIRVSEIVNPVEGD